MAKYKRIDVPSLDAEKKLDDIVENSPDTVRVRGKKWRIKWMRKGTVRKVTHIVLNEKKEDLVNVKCAAAMLLNGYFSIFFLYWLLWRWFYYVKEYTDEELLPIIEMGKKKVQVEQYYANIILLTEMKDTVMMMTREEVERFRRGSSGAQHGALEKKTDA